MIDKNSITWEAVTKKATARIEELREENDNEDNTEVETAVIRGRIAELKNLIEWPKEDEPLPDVETVGFIG